MRHGFLCSIVAAVFGLEALARAQSTPWSDEQLWYEPSVIGLSGYDLELGAEYRTVGSYAGALDLAEQKVGLIEQRLRLGAALVDDSLVRLVISVDLFDGLLYGPAGSTAGDPAWWFVNGSGPRQVEVGYRGPGSVESPDSYGLLGVPAEALALRRLYGEVPTPIGVLRLGRRAAAPGNSILYADGDGSPARFGQTGIGVVADGVELECNLLRPLDREEQATADRGLVLTVYSDHLAPGDPAVTADDLVRAGARLRLLAPLSTIERYFDAALESSYGWRSQLATEVTTWRATLDVRADALGLGGEAAYISGSTREVGAWLAPLLGEQPRDQNLRQWAARAVVRWDESWWTAYLELDHASGDRDLSPKNRLTQCYFAPDAPVGLLLFPRVLAYESARSRAALRAVLAARGLPTRGVDRVATGGAFTNATAFFPQFDLRPHPELFVRGGVLVAWTPDGLLDPAESLPPWGQGEPRNFRGGRPGHFYGVELDGRIGWRPPGHLALDLEAALFAPGDALNDGHGNADTATLLQARTTFAW